MLRHQEPHRRCVYTRHAMHLNHSRSCWVWNFALPSTSTLKTAFGFNGISAQRRHLGRYTGDDDLRAITYLYQKDALWHRISTTAGTMTPPPFTGDSTQMQIDWKSYDAEV